MNNFTDSFIHRPENLEANPPEATIGVKFCRDIFLAEAWLIKNNISYEPEDIEQTPLGPFARIKRD